jgi:hypothetical protein
MRSRSSSRLSAISQVQIDQSLVGNVQLLRQRLEVVDGGIIEPNRYGLL